MTMHDENPRYVYVPVDREGDPFKTLWPLAGVLIAIGSIGVLVLYAVHTLFTTFPVTREIWEAVWPWIKKAFVALLDLRFF